MNVELDPDFETLVRALLPFAQQMLAQYGEFYPFGATVKARGEVTADAAYPAEQPEAQEVLDLLLDGLATEARAGRIRAAGICFDSLTVPPDKAQKVDAICIKLGHVRSAPVDIFVPYRKGWRGRHEYEDPFVSVGTMKIFSADS